MIQWALNLAHDVPAAGHRGVDSTKKRLESFAFFPKSQQYITEHIKSCMKCIQFKRKFGQKAPLSKLKDTQRPWERTHVDLIGPLPTSSEQHVYVLTIIDAFTRFLIAVPLRNKTSKLVAKALFERVISVFGPMETLVSDQGSEFVSNIWKELMQTWKIKHMTTASYSPQSNGMNEKVNQSVIQILTTLVTDNVRTWSQMLYYATYAYNTAFHAALNDSPFFLLHLHDPPHPTHSINRINQQIDIENYKEVSIAMQQAAYNRIQKFLNKNRNIQEANYKPKKVELKEGMRVFIYVPPVPGSPKKFQK